MRSSPHQKFNSGIGFNIMLNGGETIDFTQLVIMASEVNHKTNLTTNNHPAILNAPRNIEGGRGNPFRLGDNTPHNLAVFLRPSFFGSRIFCRQFNIMMVLFGQSLRLVSPSRGISTPFNTVANTVESIGVGLTTLRLGITV